MKKITTEELKQIQIEMIRKIDEFCRGNNINYSLYYGSLIGAIRHHGFIPWDDDIDIAMPRPDYNRFIEGFNGCYENLCVLAPEINLDFNSSFANVCDNRTILIEKYRKNRGIIKGVKIDIFPMDGTPDDAAEYEELRNRISNLSKILVIKKYKLPYLHPWSLLVSLIQKIKFYFTDWKSVQKQILTELHKYSYEEANYIDNVAYPVYYNERVPRDYFEKYIDVEFENIKLKAISNYEKLLHQIYGDYMELPPVEKRIPHKVEAYWKDK